MKYSIADTDASLLEKFEINPDTGVITTKVAFDRSGGTMRVKETVELILFFQIDRGKKACAARN